MRARRLLVLLLATAVVFAGSATAAGLLKRHAVPGQGVSLAVPASWVAVDSRDWLTPQLLDQLLRENPSLAPFIRGIARPGSPVKFVALDPVIRQGFAANVNVVVVPVPRALTFEAYRTALVGELQGLRPIGKIENTAVRIGGKQALQLRYRFKLTVGSSFTVQTLQYAFLRPGRSIVVTYSTLPRFAGRYAATFKSSSESIRIAR